MLIILSYDRGEIQEGVDCGWLVRVVWIVGFGSGM